MTHGDITDARKSARAIFSNFCGSITVVQMTCLWLGGSTLPSDKPVGWQKNFRLASNTPFEAVG